MKLPERYKELLDIGDLEKYAILSHLEKKELS